MAGRVGVRLGANNMNAPSARRRLGLHPPLPTGTPSAHRALAWCLLLALAALLVLYCASVRSLFDVWIRSATFAHGFIIAPIAAWLVWRQRAHWRHVPIRPALLALPVLAAVGAGWLLAMVASVQVLHQFCLILLVIGSVVAIGGVALGRALAFPLAYLLLAVPFGEVFIAPLIDFTTAFCVITLQILGIPVFRENNYLTLPTGTWSVVEACSGLRYLIASLAMGAVYAYLTYRSTWRRLAFIAVSLVVPVIANGVRAALIILLGHYSDMSLALGVDHLIYGWVFFGLVTLLLFWWGARWRQPEAPVPSVPSAPAPSASPRRLAAMTAAVVTLCAIWPAIERLVAARDTAPATDVMAGRPFRLPAPPTPWTATPMAPTDWHALHRGLPRRWSANYHDGSGATVSLQLTWYQHQRRRDELLSPVRRMVVPGLPRWLETPAGQHDITVGGRRITVQQTIEQSANVKLLVWRWYRQQDLETASPVMLKLVIAKNRLLGGDDSAAEIIVASSYDDEPAPAERAMTALLDALLPAIEQGLHHVAAPR
ncbi:exosortase A [Duganella sp. FT27W]|nr:exosortase A [Duganella sp. FT27W]